MDERTALTFVTVVFEPELPLLRLQLSSLARYLDAASAAEVVVLDNCAGGMRRRARASVRAAAGPLAPIVRFVRTAELGVRRGTEGWRSQQAAKLLIARRVTTAHYVVLDAKNHLIGPAVAADFVGRDGVAKGGLHSYADHPLRPQLERTLAYLGADADRIRELVDRFPRTATPFVIDTAIARAVLDDVERRSGESFEAAFERAELLEFFLYSGWSILLGGGVPVDGEAIRASILWPSRATPEGAEAAIRAARETRASWFAVHRRVLARGDAPTRRRIAAFWVERGLMSAPEAARFFRAFRWRYVPAVGRARVAQRLSRLGSG